MVLAIDQSNWSNVPDDAAYEWLKTQGYGAVLPQAIDPPPGYPPRNVELLVQRGLDHGLAVGPYVWKWFGTGIDDIKRRVDLLTPWSGQLDWIELDVEDVGVGYALSQYLRGEQKALVPPEAWARIQRQPPAVRLKPRHLGLGAASVDQRVAEVLEALGYLKTYPTKTGAVLMYTGLGWYWGPYMGNTTAISDAGYGVHQAQYDGVADAHVVTLAGGWTEAHLKQYAGTSAVGGFTGVDLNVLHPDMEAILAGENQTPTTDCDQAWSDQKAIVIDTVGQMRYLANDIQKRTRSLTVYNDAQGIVDRANSITG